jgi:DNA invertase Pin-like site-specific DNA recombinase
MSTITTERNTHRELTFDDLKGLRAEGYIRDSTRDQKDGFGPELQHKSIETFSNTYGLNLGTAYYTDFITGTSTLKRSGFNQALSDARNGSFDVLLVYHTSRFARNRADAIRYKGELKKLGKTLVFISQNIISGRNTDFLNEGINELLDEQYSRNLSGWVADGLSLKHDSGMANGKPPLG